MKGEVDVRNRALLPIGVSNKIDGDGSKVSLDTFICFVEWFGHRVPVQVIANAGRFPLMGTELLAGRELVLNYGTKVLRLE